MGEEHRNIQLDLERQHNQHASRHIVDGIIDITGGTIGGIANTYAGQPLDTVKVKMQTFSQLYRSSVHCLADTYKAQGIRGLYAGAVPAMAANVGENAILFCAYGGCQKLIARLTGKTDIKLLNPIENAFAGSGAAFFASFALCPTELIKCKLQAMREMHNTGQLKGPQIGPVGLVKSILAAEGIRGMYRGMVPTLAREVPGYFFFFGGYEICRYLFTPVGGTKDDIGAVRTILSGGVGGMSLWLIMFPADVIKSRVQVSGGQGSMLATGRHILAEQGMAGLYKGLPPTLVRTFLATGALFFTYENSTKFLHSLLD